MSGFVLGRAVRCLGAATAAAMLLCPAGLALGQSLPGAASGEEGLAAGYGTITAAPDRTTLPEASASRGCAYQNRSVSRTPAADLRAAVACLINQARASWHLPALRTQGEVEQAAQRHTGQMVAIDSLTHVGAGGSSPGARLDQAGYRWAAWGEIIASGYRTPRGVVRAWLGSVEHCQIMLSPQFSALGVGVVPVAVSGVASAPGTWTVDFVLPAGHRPPSRSYGPANSCPH